MTSVYMSVYFVYLQPSASPFVWVRANACVCSQTWLWFTLLLSLPNAVLCTLSPLSPLPEPGPLMKLGVSNSVWLIGQVCLGLSSEGPPYSRRCNLLFSTSTAKTVSIALSASP